MNQYVACDIAIEPEHVVRMLRGAGAKVQPRGKPTVRVFLSRRQASLLQKHNDLDLVSVIRLSPKQAQHTFQHGGGILDFLKAKYALAKVVIFGRQGPSPKIRELLSTMGNNRIVSIQVCRDPVQSGILYVVNWLTAGTFNQQKKELGYEDIFHLYLVLGLQQPNGSVKFVRLEKNHVVETGPETGPHSSGLVLQLSNAHTSLENFIKNGVGYQGGDQFWQYSNPSNNCQVFVLSCLQGNSHLVTVSPNILQFVKQDAHTLLAKTPEMSKFIMNGATDLAGRFDVLLHGAGAGVQRQKYQ